jgi:hypothetical protein
VLESPEGTLVYERVFEDRRFVVVINFSDRSVEFADGERGELPVAGEVVLTSYRSGPDKPGAVPASGALVLRATRTSADRVSRPA